ncbi:MAG: cupin domain-containing protein [Spirochaetaceae bacterium]|jgi:mannose-6-phosphate isomerase-like protein (cupin superfamily)|nr:cupin domain-containing protein [Spirochaetaceae bacterium]
MLIHQNQRNVEYREKPRNGEGMVTFSHFVDETKEQHLKLLAELTLPPGASIGPHQHDKETEYFIFLEGNGVVNDNGTEVPVKKGDVAVTGNGNYHSVKNTGTVPLVLHAVIILH